MPSNRPTHIIIPQKEEDVSFSISFEYYKPDEKLELNIIKQISKEIFEILLEKIKIDIPNLMTFANFLGEAEVYMSSKNIPYSPKIREQYAIAIYNDFISVLDKMIIYNKEDGSISISPYIYALESGDFYRPGIGFISNCIKKWISEIGK